ncbi:hypothetical protein [Streptomyces sp. M92]|uniref:hypothetical protein n=1 Tax=Streptomyces sp. M92 TaxID=2944250 RepID=UPI0023493B9B|nr:hypothetical protein [Streptomyces sp. M92]WCN06059.1 hypothetical protein M6G08_30455 [Streptomyces sp. M92]
MTENQSEPQLADQARTALLEAITQAANGGNGETARQFAEAYSILKANAPSEAKGTTVVRPPLAGRR